MIHTIETTSFEVINSIIKNGSWILYSKKFDLESIINMKARKQIISPLWNSLAKEVGVAADTPCIDVNRSCAVTKPERT